LINPAPDDWNMLSSAYSMRSAKIANIFYADAKKTLIRSEKNLCAHL
jgi:hypothetical protein